MLYVPGFLTLGVVRDESMQECVPDAAVAPSEFLVIVTTWPIIVVANVPFIVLQEPPPAALTPYPDGNVTTMRPFFGILCVVVNTIVALPAVFRSPVEGCTSVAVSVPAAENVSLETAASSSIVLSSNVVVLIVYMPPAPAEAGFRTFKI